MSNLATDLRNKLERTCIAARKAAEQAAHDALFALGVTKHHPPEHLGEKQRELHSGLRARAQALGDLSTYHATVEALPHLVNECAYEQWHRMLFARFLAENNLLIEPEMDVAVSLEEVKELAKDAKTNLWAMAGRYAQTMLPEIFRADDPVLQVPLAREDQIKLEALLDALATDTFTASDSLGWCYQFWQAERKDQVNAAGNKIGADELPSVTQLFTEDYMVDFLLDNTLGAWHAGKVFAANPKLAESAKSEEELRKAIALPGCPWKYLRFIKGKDGKWTPAAGTFDGWPKTTKELKCLDPCCGSGHFIVAMFERVVALRMAEEKLAQTVAVQAAIRENIFGLELDPRCTQIGAFSLALAAWRRVGHCALPAMHIACSGLAPNARLEDWLKLAGDDGQIRNGMTRLHQLFKSAPVLGSLINPRVTQDELLEAGFHKLQPLLAKALEGEKFRLREGAENPADLEMAVTAQGIARAAEILAGQFTLVATNVPYLGRGKQADLLRDYCENVHPQAKSDLATCFVERSLDFCQPGGSITLVTPQNWWFLSSYTDYRRLVLDHQTFHLLATLGEEAWQSFGDRGPMAALITASRIRPDTQHPVFAIDALPLKIIESKIAKLLEGELIEVGQDKLRANPDSRLSFEAIDSAKLLSNTCQSWQGLVTSDNPRFMLLFWEVWGKDWEAYISSPTKTRLYGGRENVVYWSAGSGALHREGRAHNFPPPSALGRKGILLSQVRSLSATIYSGEIFAHGSSPVIPSEESILPALWCFISTTDYQNAVRNIDKKTAVTNGSLLKVEFDLAHWQRVAAQKYPDGLPKPFSSDPTQWLFNGHPKAADHPLQVAVARLVGYQWPRQTGSNFPDCPALGLDGLEKLADDDGIVCLPSVRGESPAAERVRQLLQAAYGKDWKAHTELELIRASGSDAADLEEWLRNDFFEQHCDIFQQRPFVWHIWDGRKRDGFHALVNYHTLAGDKGKGRRTLESLTHSYLGDWITRQKDGLKRGEEGADERLAAALALKETLEAIINGEPPYDVFVRWKGLPSQAIGWNPDINDGVRMNIRPFMASDIPDGKKGAGVLRIRPNIKWDKDRGKEPERDKAEYPWFYDGSTFTGDRVNDVHLTKEQKEKARN